MHIYGKALAMIQDGADDSEFGPHGGFRAVLSTPSEDRDFEEVKRTEWIEPLPVKCTLDADHGMTVADTIGSFEPYFDNDTLMMKASFASTPKAQEVRTLITEGHISTVSVAFMRHKDKKAASEPFRELLNAGVVAIPANRDAVILASKAASALKDAFSDAGEDEDLEEVKAAVLEALSPKAEPKKGGSVYIDIRPRIDEDAFIKAIADVMVKAGATASGVGGDGALVQAIHDASSHLGAACPVIEVEVTDEGTGASSGANKGLDEETFVKALDEVLPPDAPADEVAAATDEVPAPTDDAAAKAKKRARELEALQLRAKHSHTT